MARKLWVILTSLALGCQSTPGFRIGAEFTIPPTLNTTATLTPMPAAASTVYAVDGPHAVPVMQRQFLVSPPPSDAPQEAPAPLVPKRQLLPMPKASPPCQTSCRITNADSE